MIGSNDEAMTQGAEHGLADRYHELMVLRREALAKYRASEFSVGAGPTTRVTLPSVSLTGPGKKRVGPLYFDDRAPIVEFVERAIRSCRAPATVLEIGPGRGELARTMLERHRTQIAEYLAFDRDASLAGPYTRLPDLASVPPHTDVVIAAEVIEHMSADNFYATYLSPIARKMDVDGSFIVSTPNPVAPGGIARDLTHVQHYPWYDLYALFRLVFEEVAIYRTYYVFEPSRVFSLVPRIVLCSLLELDWRDGLVCVARRPRVVSSS